MGLFDNPKTRRRIMIILIIMIIIASLLGGPLFLDGPYPGGYP